MAKSPQSTAVAPKPHSEAVPGYLQSGAKTVRVGNIDQSDLVIPRVKLIHATSKEVDTFNTAKVGEFWHTVAAQSLGSLVRIVPVIMRKSYVLWAPRNDERGILARARDGIHWDPPEGEFTVKPKGSPKEVTYKLAPTVAASGLANFGTSIPDNPRSAPAASLVYEFLCLFPDFLDLGPAIVLNSRSSVRPGRMLLTKIEARPGDHYAQVFEMGVVGERNNDGDDYKNYTYTAAGYAEEAVYNMAKEKYEYFSKQDWLANDESEDEGAAGGDVKADPSAHADSKF